EEHHLGDPPVHLPPCRLGTFDLEVLKRLHLSPALELLVSGCQECRSDRSYILRVLRDYDLCLEEITHGLDQATNERRTTYHDHRLLDVHFLELLFEDLFGDTVTGGSSDILTR